MQMYGVLSIRPEQCAPKMNNEKLLESQKNFLKKRQYDVKANFSRKDMSKSPVVEKVVW